MRFLNRKHALNFQILIGEDNTHPADSERNALFYILAGNDDLFKKRYHIYDFKDNSIKPECLSDGTVNLCTSSSSLIRMGFNLYNGYEDNHISPLDIFYSLDAANYNLAINAIDIRFGKFKEKALNVEDELEEELEF